MRRRRRKPVMWFNGEEINMLMNLVANLDPKIHKPEYAALIYKVQSLQDGDDVRLTR